MSFAKINKPVNIEDNFWTKNPWLKIHPPYSTLYKLKGEELSSQIMVAVFLMCDPDEEVNPFYRMDEEYRKKTIAANFIDVDWEEEIVQKCLESYPFDCMDTIQRSYKEEKEKIRERAKFIKKTQYKLDIPEAGEDVDKELIKIQMDTIKLIEAMQKNSLTIYQQYDKIEQQFIQGKNSAVKQGGGKLTRAEKREV